MADQTKETTRKQLSKIAGLETSHARVRSFLCDRFINREQTDKINELKSRMEDIKKKGAPALPSESPVNPGKNATDAQKRKYATEKAAYDASVSAYNKFVSDEYVELTTAHAVVKHLIKMGELLEQGALSVSNQKELTKLQEGFTSINQYKNESDETFAKRNQFHGKIMGLVKSVDTSSKASVASGIESLQKSYPNLAIMLEKDEWSRNSLRINDKANIAMATIIDKFISELTVHCMETTLKTQKTTSADSCVSEGVENLSLYPLVCNLPHFIAVEDRIKRRAEYAVAKKAADDEAAKKARAAAKRKEEKYSRPTSKYPTFENMEVRNGHAEKHEKETVNKKGEPCTKVKYFWYDIDIDRDEEDEGFEVSDPDHGFNHYIRNICKKVKEEKVNEGYEDYNDILIGTGMVRFFSNLIIDFIARMTPLIIRLLRFKGSSTVTHEVVKVALAMILIDSRVEVDGTDTLSEDHEELMNTIDSKIRIVTEHLTRTKSADGADGADGAEGDADEDVDELEEDIAEPVAKPAAPRRRRVRT